jgi:capsular exopolysaccharide synthesis family protein
MSRVDEALARARRTSDDPPAAPPAVPLNLAHGSSASWSEEAEPVVSETPLPPTDVPSIASPQPEPEPDGRVTLEHLATSAKLVIGSEVNSGTVEQFRRLAAQLYLAQTEHGIRAVMIASALPGEGKTLTAVNLALTLSESYQRSVLLVDGDLRRPSAHQVFEVPNVSGLNDGVRSEVERKVPLIRISEHLTLLTAGRPEADPMGVLTSDRMRRVLEEAREKFDWVIIDTPPLALLTDAHLLASLVDAAVLVVHAAKTPAAAIKRVMEVIGRDRIAGVVLNRVQDGQVQTEYGSYHYYGNGNGNGNGQPA